MDVNEIKEVIQAYFDTGYACDSEGMAKVFHDGSHLYGLGKDGELLDWPKEMFLKVLAETKQGYPRYDEIVSIDYTGEDTAVARVKVRVEDTIYTDILSFLRLDGKWGVMAKVYAGVPAE